MEFRINGDGNDININAINQKSNQEFINHITFILFLPPTLCGDYIEGNSSIENFD